MENLLHGKHRTHWSKSSILCPPSPSVTRRGPISAQPSSAWEIERVNAPTTFQATGRKRKRRALQPVNLASDSFVLKESLDSSHSYNGTVFAVDLKSRHTPVQPRFL